MVYLAVSMRDDGLTGAQRHAARIAAVIKAQPLSPDRMTRQRYRLQARELAKGTEPGGFGRRYTPSPLTAREHYQALTAPPPPPEPVKPKRAPRKKR